MATIPGASGFLNAATLANRQGIGAQQATVLGEGGIGGVDILDVARANAPSNGVGLSSRARLLNQQFLDSSSSTFNQIFSLGLGGSATIEGLQQQILALRAKTPASALSREISEERAEAEATAAADRLSSSSATLSSSPAAVDAEA